MNAYVGGVVEIAPVVDRPTGQQRPQHIQRFVGPTTPGGWIHAHHLHLVAVLPAHPDPEREAPWGVEGQSRDLAGHGHRVAQGQKVDAQVHADRGVQTSQPRHGGQAIHAPPTEEGNVIGGQQVVKATVGHRPDVVRCLVPGGEPAWGERHTDPDPRVGGRAHGVRFSPNRSHEVIFSAPRCRGATPHFPVGWPRGSRASTS